MLWARQPLHKDTVLEEVHTHAHGSGHWNAITNQNSKNPAVSLK